MLNIETVACVIEAVLKVNDSECKAVTVDGKISLAFEFKRRDLT